VVALTGSIHHIRSNSGQTQLAHIKSACPASHRAQILQPRVCLSVTHWQGVLSRTYEDYRTRATTVTASCMQHKRGVAKPHENQGTQCCGHRDRHTRCRRVCQQLSQAYKNISKPHYCAPQLNQCCLQGLLPSARAT
jgi:hypothetical protein